MASLKLRLQLLLHRYARKQGPIMLLARYILSYYPVDFYCEDCGVCGLPSRGRGRAKNRRKRNRF